MDKKVYVLVRVDWNACEDTYDYEEILGIFDSEELITKAADNYIRKESELVKQVNDEDESLEAYIIPDGPLTLKQLKIGYIYYNWSDYEGKNLCVYGPYEMNKLSED